MNSNPQQDENWKSTFPTKLVLILSIAQFIFTIIIFILEIASLAVLNFRPTGVGIWASVPFFIASILTFILARKKEGSRLWSKIVLFAQITLLIFTFILIGITGNYVQTNTYYTLIDILITTTGSYTTKYQLVQTQLAFGILLMFSGFVYIGIFIYVTYVALYKPFKIFW